MPRHSKDHRLLNGWHINPNDLVADRSPSIQAMLKLLETAEFRKRLATAFNIEQPLFCDPDYKGAGLLSAKSGGVHQIHRDRNRHPHTHFYRRLVLLIYFNPDWQPEHGGELQLWDKKIKTSVTIPPLFNRCVIFENSQHAFHGISTVNLPEGMTRKALNFQYYTEEPPAPEQNTHIYNTEFFACRQQRLEFWKNVTLTHFPIRLMETAVSRSEVASRFLQDSHLRLLALELKAALLKKRSPEKHQTLIKSTQWNLFHKPDSQLIECWREYNSY
jgi:hypothetical protein